MNLGEKKYQSLEFSGWRNHVNSNYCALGGLSLGGGADSNMVKLDKPVCSLEEKKDD